MADGDRGEARQPRRFARSGRRRALSPTCHGRDLELQCSVHSLTYHVLRCAVCKGGSKGSSQELGAGLGYCELGAGRRAGGYRNSGPRRYELAAEQEDHRLADALHFRTTPPCEGTE